MGGLYFGLSGIAPMKGGSRPFGGEVPTWIGSRARQTQLAVAPGVRRAEDALGMHAMPSAVP
jgi:hypothetical protein